jgi:hypothetical protein
MVSPVIEVMLVVRTVKDGSIVQLCTLAIRVKVGHQTIMGVNLLITANSHLDSANQEYGCYGEQSGNPLHVSHW